MIYVRADGHLGTGNFDNDTAADHLSIITGRLLDDLKKAMKGKAVELEPDEYWGNAVPCNIEILTLFAEKKWARCCPTNRPRSSGRRSSSRPTTAPRSLPSRRGVRCSSRRSIVSSKP